jgi:pimeloyl-ACP methyl ester carboxylesterase
MKYPHKVNKLVLVSSLCLGGIAWWIKLLSHPALIMSIGTLATKAFELVRWMVEKAFPNAKFVPPFSRASMLLYNSIATPRVQIPVCNAPFSEVKMPTLIVWGARDQIVPAENAYSAAQLIPACQLKVFEGCGHSVYKQKMSQFTDLVAGFLN